MRLKRLLLMVVITVPFAALGACLWAGAEIAQPSRRPLQPHHVEFLNAPAAHGVEVKAFTLDDGTPCLMATPSTTLGRRGQNIRDQLTARGVAMGGPSGIVGTLVLVHGRPGRKEDHLFVAERFCAVGFRCLMMDLPSHGDHPAGVATYGIREHTLPAQVLKEAAQRFVFDPRVAGLVGISMGGAVSVRAAAIPDAPWRALVLISTFDSLENVVAHQCRERIGDWVGGLWQKGVGWEFRRRTGHALSEAESLSSASAIHCPVLMAHGTTDRVIPMALGARLFAALPDAGENQWVAIPEADHNNVLITDFPIYATLAEWLLKQLTKA